MSLRRFVKQVKKPVQEIKVKPINKVSDFLSEALEYKGENDDQFAVELVAEIDDNIGSIDGEISKDARPGKNTGKRIGVQIVLPDSKRIAFTSMANEVIGKEVAWISFLIEGEKKRENQSIDNSRSTRTLRHYKVNTIACNEFINTI